MLIFFKMTVFLFSAYGETLRMSAQETCIIVSWVRLETWACWGGESWISAETTWLSENLGSLASGD